VEIKVKDPWGKWVYGEAYFGKEYECGDSVVVKLQILGLTFSPIRLGLWSTS
jgi:hypothetical protein